MKQNNWFERIGAYLYGLWIAAVYIGIVKLEGHMSIASFAAAAGIGAVALTLFQSAALIRALRAPGAWLRGVLFVATQYCTFTALLVDGAPAAFSSAAATYIILLPAAAFFVHEPIGTQSLLSAVVGAMGLAFLAPAGSLSWMGVAGGALQALSIVIARRFGRSRIPIIGNVALGLWLSLPLVFVTDINPVWRDLDLLKLGFVAVLVMFTQIYFVWLAEKVPSRKVNEISQTRVFWALVLTCVISGKVPSLLEVFGGTLVTLSAFLGPQEPLVADVRA